jgi:hypothetical protein
MSSNFWADMIRQEEQQRIVMLEAALKRDLVRQLLKEGSYGRRLEDKFAVGTLDLLLVTERYTIYAEAKILKDIVTLPARVAQREEIKRFNDVGNPRAKAMVIGYRDGHLGFGLPGARWDARYTARWPMDEIWTLTVYLDEAVEQVFGPMIREVA